ncbi:hypothetical protein FS749_000185 [Ceratobasidium sp. UAMH 11750]|nr:hypothetical protein FS749_000185 [Ceratobasidium sp. UAMH 11750]
MPRTSQKAMLARSKKGRKKAKSIAEKHGPSASTGGKYKSATAAAIEKEEIPVQARYKTNIPFELATGDVKPLEGSTVRWYDEWRSRGLLEDDGNSPVVHSLAVNAYAFTLGPQFHMVVPVDLEGTGTELVGWATSLHTGARRAHRAVSGYHPTAAFRSGSMTDAWKMESVLVRDKIRILTMKPKDVWGLEVTGSWAVTMDGKRHYLLQNAHPDFQRHFDRAREARPAILPWQDIDIRAARPCDFNKWAMGMLRLEEGVQAVLPNDPPRGPDLRTPEGRQEDSQDLLAERGEGDFEGGTQDESALDMLLERRGEAGETDASSVTTDDDRELPTGLHWRDGHPTPWPRETNGTAEPSKSMRRALAAGRAAWEWDNQEHHIVVWIKGVGSQGPGGANPDRPSSRQSETDAPGEVDPDALQKEDETTKRLMAPGGMNSPEADDNIARDLLGGSSGPPPAGPAGPSNAAAGSSTSNSAPGAPPRPHRGRDA